MVHLFRQVSNISKGQQSLKSATQVLTRAEAEAALPTWAVAVGVVQRQIHKYRYFINPIIWTSLISQDREIPNTFHPRPFSFRDLNPNLSISYHFFSSLANFLDEILFEFHHSWQNLFSLNFKNYQSKNWQPDIDNQSFLTACTIMYSAERLE